MHIYIASEPGNPVLGHCMYTIIIPDSDPFLPSTHLNSQGSIPHMPRLKVQSALLKRIAITSCQVLIFMDD